MKLKSILAIALCAVGMSAFADDPLGSKDNPWEIGTPTESDVEAWTNGTGRLDIDGTGAMMGFSASSPAPWADGSFTEAVVGSNVTAIGANAFKSCPNLKTLVLNEQTPPTLGAGNDFAGVKIFVPAGKAGAYRASEGWKAYKDAIKEMGSVKVDALSNTFALDLTVGDRVAKDTETLVVDPAWDETDPSLAKVFIDGEEEPRQYTVATNDTWETAALEPGRYELEMQTSCSSYPAGFWKLGDDWVVFDSSNITADVTFQAGKTYLFFGTNTVDATLKVEDGAKFFYDEGAPTGFKGGTVTMSKRYGKETVEDGLYQIVEKIKGCEDNPWVVGEGVEAWTNGSELVIGGAGTVGALSGVDGLKDLLTDLKEINVTSNGVTGAEADAFENIGTEDEPVLLTLPDGWQGELPDDGGNWYGATVNLMGIPLSVRNVTFLQRYPWNGKVDVGFTLTGPEGETNVVVTVCTNGTKIADFTAAVTIPADGVLATNLVWDAMTAGLAANFKSDDVTAEVAPEGAPAISAKSAAGMVDLRTAVALAEGEVTVAGVSYSDTAWGAADPADVTLGYTNETTDATGVLKTGLAGEDVAEVDLPKKNGDYRLTHSTGDLTSFVTFVVSGYPLGSEGNPWLVGAGEDPDGVVAWTDGNGNVYFKPPRSAVSREGLETITNALGGASFPVKLISEDGSATNDLVMVLGASGTVYDTIADALYADETSCTLFDVNGYLVSYNGGEGAVGTMATDTFVPTVPTNLTANAYTIVGYAFTGWSTDGVNRAYDDCAAGVDFVQPGETLSLTALWEQVAAVPASYDDLTNMLANATRPVTITLDEDIEIPVGGTIVVPAGKDVTFAGEGKFDVTAERPALFCGYPVGTGLKPEDLDRFVTDKDVKAYYEDGKVVVRGRGETEEFPWLLGTEGHEDEVTGWAGNEMILAKPARGTASVAALQSVTNALSGYVPGPGQLKVISADGTATNDVVMLLGSDGVPYDTLADVFAADPMPETVKLYEVKGANVEFNAMGGVHTNGLETVTNFCIVTYTLPEVERKGYTFDGWYNDWKPGATKVEDGQDLLSYEPHPLYAVWTSNKPTPTAGELDIPDVTNGVPVTSIDAKQYVNDTSLKNVTTPLYLKSIGQRAFMGCTSLEKLTITAARDYGDLSPVTVEIGQNAFSGCSSLDTVCIAAEVSEIGQSAFQNCANLKKIIFMGDGAITYGASAFYRCGYQNGTGALKVYMSSAFQAANPTLIADFQKWNTQVQVIEKVDVAPVNGSADITSIDFDNLPANRRVAVLVKTSVLGTPDPDDVDIEHMEALNGTWSPLTAGTEKTTNPDGTVLIEVKVPEVPQGFFRVVVRE